MPAPLKWTEKYRPATLKQVLGNGKAIDDLREWALSWERSEPITGAVILYGPAGTGKTSAALALAHDFDWDYIEMNASDARTAGMIEKIAVPASRSQTFSGKPRLVILDEADNLHGTADRGGAAAMLRLVRNTLQPVILIANEYYEIDKSLRAATRGIQFRSVRSTTIAQALRAICQAEGIDCNPDLLVTIAERAGGDMRSGINDLQAAAEGQETLREEDLATAQRDVKSSIFRVLEVIYKGNNAKEALEASYNLDESPEDLINWVDENLPLAYSGQDLLRGFETLARSDIFLGQGTAEAELRPVALCQLSHDRRSAGGKEGAQAWLCGLPSTQPVAKDGPDPQSQIDKGLCRQKDRQALPCIARLRPLGADGLCGNAAQRQERRSPTGRPVGSDRRGDRSAHGKLSWHKEGAEHLRGSDENSKQRTDRGDRAGMAEEQPTHPQ